MAVRNGAIDEVLGEGEVAVIRAITDDGIITLIWDGKVLENILFGFQCQPRGNVKLSVFQKDSKPIQNIIGYPDSMVRPQGNITRAETMAVVNRVLQRLPRSKENLLPGMITWPDNMDEDAWYYLYVQEATNGHTYERVNGSEHWIDWEETPDWKQYER